MKRDLRNRLYIATMCENWESIANEYGIGLEIDHFCQAENMEGQQGEETKAAVKKLLETHRAGVFHAPFNELFPAAIDVKARELAMERLNAAASIAQAFGIKKMVVHSGYVPFVYFKSWQVERSIEFWSQFLEDKPSDFEVAIENVLEEEPSMLVEIAKGVNLPNLGLCFDVGHANVTANAYAAKGASIDEWFEHMAPYLKHLHIHNNDGKGDYHRDFGDGNIDVEDLLTKVTGNCLEETTITAETIYGEESFKWLKERDFI